METHTPRRGAAVLKTKHTIRKNHVGDEYVSISLPTVPGVVIDGDRSETEPRSKLRRKEPVPIYGAALSATAKRRVEMFRQALIEISKEPKHD
jgi:hypothetical protein